MGFSHMGLSTCDMDATINFYREVLGFSSPGENQIAVEEGGYLRQVMFDVGNGQFVVFLESHDVPGIAKGYDAGVTTALGVPNMFYHVAFSVESLEALDAMRSDLISKGIQVSPIVDHGPGKSIYLKDPNQLQLEFSAEVREFDAGDAQGAFKIRRDMLNPND